MPLSYAIYPKQPGENEPWSFEYIPGKNIPEGDSLTGTPTVTCYEIVSKTDTTVVAETTSAMIEGVSRSGNTVLWRVKGGTSGKWYKATVKANTTLGGQNIEEDIVFQVLEY